MKHILSYFFLLFLLLLCPLSLYTQNTAPVLKPEIISLTKNIDESFKDWEKLYVIYDKIYNEEEEKRITQDELPEKDKQYISFMEKRYGISDGEGEAPWNSMSIGCSWYCGAVYESKASSELPSAGKNSYSISNIEDDDIRTAWVEGVSGYGIGEYIEFTFENRAPRATSCRIANGYSKNETTWRNNSRVKTLNMYENDVLTAILELKDIRDFQVFSFPHPIGHRKDGKASKLKFVITEVYKGDKYEDTAISEFLFDGLDVHCLEEGTIITMADNSEVSIENIKRGDIIRAYDETDLTELSLCVKEIYKAVHDEIVELTFSTGIKISLTVDHPLLSSGTWYSFNPQKTLLYKRYNKVEEYRPGTEILVKNSDGKIDKATITEIKVVSKKVNTYTLELEKNGAFTANGILVGQE